MKKSTLVAAAFDARAARRAASSERSGSSTAALTASEVADPCRLLEQNPQLQARGYFETPDHPVVGPMPIPGFPFRYASRERWLRTPAPTMGEHNEAVLGGLLGCSPGELEALARADITGTRPKGL